MPGATRVPYGGRVFDESERELLVYAFLDFRLTYGRYSERFESELGSFLGAGHYLLVNSGSSANLPAFMALTSDRPGDRRIKRGDEAITVAAGFPTTVAPIVRFGAAVLAFVGARPDTANVDVEQLEAAVWPRAKAVMLAHALGNPFDVDGVRSVCDPRGLWLVEDNRRGAATGAETGAGFSVVGDLSGADRIMDDSFWVGVYPGLTVDMLDHMADQFLAACGRPRP